MKKFLNEHESKVLVFMFCFQVGALLSVTYIIAEWIKIFLKWGFAMKLLRFFGLVSVDENGNEYIEKSDRNTLICLALTVLIAFVVGIAGLIANGWINNDCCIDAFINASCKEW